MSIIVVINREKRGRNMYIVDAIIILLILACGVVGFKKGVIKQLVTTIGFILVVVLAFYLKNPVAEFLSLNLPFFSFGESVANAASLNIILYQLISFILVIIVLQAILSALIKFSGFIEKILKFTIILGIPSKILGFIVGIIEGFVVAFIILFFLKQPLFNLNVFEDSKLTDPILNSTPVLSQVAGDFVDAFNDLYELGNDFYEDKLNENELNLKSIDVMLEHQIITPEYVIKLVEADKIDVVGIDSIINKYR